MESQTSRLMNIDEAGAYLRLSTSTLHKYTSSRRIPFYKIGKRLYFVQHDLEQFIAGRRTEAVGPDTGGR
jgi:excisionase family DNA binding protein